VASRRDAEHQLPIAQSLTFTHNDQRATDLGFRTLLFTCDQRSLRLREE